jgi:MoaA/NifB/PqqE/SkfB family radical SAM enzyme
MKELTININRDFSKYIGGREKKISKFSGEAFREEFLEENFKNYDRLIVELDGTLGYPWDFLDETFGGVAREHGKEKFWEKFDLISHHNYVTDKITYIVNHSEKDK